MGIIQEFKEFAVKGNALDMAVGIIIGAAFNKIVTSLVNDIIMPPVGMLLGGVDFKNLAVTLKSAFTDDKGVVHEAVQLRWGLFINNIIDFLIVAFTVFIMVKAMNKVLKLRPGPKVT